MGCDLIMVLSMVLGNLDIMNSCVITKGFFVLEIVLFRSALGSPRRLRGENDYEY